MTRRRWSAVLGSVAFSAAAVGATTAAASGPIPVSGGQPTVAVGEGFAPGAVVELRLPGRPPEKAGRADRRGTVRVTIVAPLTPGAYRVLLVGAAADGGPGGGAAPAGPGDQQVVVARLPQVVSLDYAVLPPPTVLPEASVPPTGGDAGAGGAGNGAGTRDAGGTASTGTELRLLLPVGLGAVLVGAGLTVLARRRRGHAPTHR